MKNLSFTLFLLFTMSISNPMLAQNPEDMDMGNIIEFLEARVDLSDEQVAELENIIAQYEVDLTTLEEQDFENFLEKLKAYADLKMNFWQQIKSVLSEEQLAELGMRGGDRGDHDDDDHDGDWRDNPCHPDSLDLEGVRAALDAYRTETIKPAMLELRAGLDEAISAEDQIRIDELRTAITDFKTQMQALKEEARQEGADREVIRARMMELKQAMKENFEALKELLERYREDIKAAFESISEEREEWAAAMQAIRVDYLGEECANRYRHGRRGHEGRGGREHHRGDRRGHHRSDRGHAERRHHGQRGKKAARFLLLDTSGERLNDTPSELPAHTLAVSPNPATDFTTLTYKVVADARIIILLQDNKGNVLKRLVDAQTTAGTYTLDVDLSRYRTGSYYFSLSDGVQLISQPTIITKE